MQRIFRSPLLALLLLLPMTGMSGTISTADIVSQTTTAALSCMRWMPVGVCFWLRCSLIECSVETSIKVGHYQPDAVVSSYNDTGRQPLGGDSPAPWEWRSKPPPPGYWAVCCPYPSTVPAIERKDPAAIAITATWCSGKPMWWATHWVPGRRRGGYRLRVRIANPVPSFPISSRDWTRCPGALGVPEMFYPASLIPGLREIGQLAPADLGRGLPAHGLDDAGGGTQGRRDQRPTGRGHRHPHPATPHLCADQRRPAVPTSDSGRPAHWWKAIRATGEWQMLLPKAESSCAVFGTNDLASVNGWGGGRVDPEGDYAWNLWRPYACCSEEGELFLFDINWINYPP